MTIEDNKKYKLTGEQIKDLASRLSILGSEADGKAEKALSGSTAPTTSTPGEIGQLYIQSDGTVYILKNIVEESGQPDEYTWEEVGAGGPTVVQTTGTSTTDVMSQNATTNAIKAISQSGAGAPTTSTVGTVGQLYQDTTNGDLYICTDATNPYVWEEVGAGGGGSSSITELTSADYNYDYGSTGTNNCIALWLLSEGTYSWATTLRSSVRVTTTETAGDLSADGALVIAASNAILAKVYLYGDGSATTATGRNILQMYRVNKTNGTSNVSGAAITTRELKQSTGNSQSDIMSQNATTSMVFADPATQYKVKIGAGTSTSVGANGVEIGRNAGAGEEGVALGYGAYAGAKSTALGHNTDARGAGAVAIGDNCNVSGTGVVGIGTILKSTGYNNSNYRLLTGLYDPQSDHDAATKGYVDNSLLGKQDALTAGSGISIADESGSLVISTTVAEPDEFTSNEWNALWS